MYIAYSLLIAQICLGMVVQAHANVYLAPLFTEPAVLQNGKRVPEWRRTDADARIAVAHIGQTSSAVAGADRRWLVYLEPHPTSGFIAIFNPRDQEPLKYYGNQRSLRRTWREYPSAHLILASIVGIVRRRASCHGLRGSVSQLICQI